MPHFLTLAEKENNDERCFYNISEEIFIDVELPEIRGRRCWGSPFGWLVTRGLDLEIQLFNPLSRTSFLLPSLRTFSHQQNRPSAELCLYFIEKLILSSSPASLDCIVLAIYSKFCCLAFGKPGDEAWTPIDATPPFFDAISFNGSFLNTGQLFLCQDLNLSHPKAVEFASQPPTDADDRTYLVDSGGNLCLLSRVIDSYLVIPDYGPKRDVEVDTFLTTEFEIFKLDMCTRNWEKIFSLGDRSLFLGNCYTFSVVAADYNGCRTNCIYFTNDNADFHDRIGGFDTAICCCDNNKKAVDEDPPKDPFPESDDVQDLLYSSFSPPLWIIPYPS